METLVYTTRVSSEKKKSFREKCEHFRFFFAKFRFNLFRKKNAKFPQNRKLDNFAKKIMRKFSEQMRKYREKNGNYAKKIRKFNEHFY